VATAVCGLASGPAAAHGRQKAAAAGWQTPESTGICMVSGLWPGKIWSTRCVVVMGEEQGGIRLRDRLLAAGDRPRLKLRLLHTQ
jgi:hypothetical protein